ncbi:hypothetical protein Q7P37_010976 [Cladosporium fusiforme]
MANNNKKRPYHWLVDNTEPTGPYRQHTPNRSMCVEYDLAHAQSERTRTINSEADDRRRAPGSMSALEQAHARLNSSLNRSVPLDQAISACVVANIDAMMRNAKPRPGLLSVLDVTSKDNADGLDDMYARWLQEVATRPGHGVDPVDSNATASQEPVRAETPLSQTMEAPIDLEQLEKTQPASPISITGAEKATEPFPDYLESQVSALLETWLNKAKPNEEKQHRLLQASYQNQTKQLKEILALKRQLVEAEDERQKLHVEFLTAELNKQRGIRLFCSRMEKLFSREELDERGFYTEVAQMKDLCGWK